MTEAFAIKRPNGELIVSTIADTRYAAWAKSGHMPNERPTGFTCVLVTVSEKGEADELPVDYFHSVSEILRRIDAYLARKEQ